MLVTCRDTMGTKKTIGIIIILALMSGCSGKKGHDGASAMDGKITISGSWALYPMALKWASEYRRQNPGTEIEISAGGAGKGLTDALSGAVDLGMVSRDVTSTEIGRGAWWISVARDAVVPVINERHPLKEALLKRGLTRNECVLIWITGSARDWGRFVKSDTPCPIRVYTRSDACGAAGTWAKYAGGSQEDLKGTGVYGDPGITNAVRSDIFGIGYNNVNYAFDAATKAPVRGVIPLPIDSNGNGMIDPAEDFYADRDSLMKAISENRFPSPPARNLHLVSRGIPREKEVIRFLLWILGEGQRFVPETGYIPLPPDQLKRQAETLARENR